MAEWLPAEHLVWFVLEVVEQLDTAVFHRRHPEAGPGRRAYDPDMLLGLLVYAYAVGQRSSRQVERLCETDVAFRVVCAQDVPDHSTIARFRARHEDALADLFQQVLVLCARAGMGRVGTVAIDGTKIAADASMDANRTEGWLAEEARRILAEASAVDAAEDEQLGDARGDELPEEFTDPGTRTERIRAALEQLRDKKDQAQQAGEETRQRAQEYLAAVEAGAAPVGRPPSQVDPERLAQARLARGRRRWAQATGARERSRARIAIDRAGKSLQAAQAKRRAAELEERAARRGPDRPEVEHPDREQPKPVKHGKQPKANTTDPDSRMMSTRRGWVQGYNGQVAVSDDHLILATSLTADPTDTLWFEPMMNAAITAAARMHPHRPAPVGETGQAVGDGGILTLLADAGYHSEKNLTGPGPDRLIALGTARELHRAAKADPAAGPPPREAPPTERMRHRLRTPEGEQHYKRRAATVEPVIGHLKDRIGLRRFSRRGLKAAASELDFAAAVANLLKLHGQTSPAAS
jgi:transposase